MPSPAATDLGTILHLCVNQQVVVPANGRIPLSLRDDQKCGTIQIGMGEEQVIAALYQPHSDRIDTTIAENTIIENWIYPEYANHNKFVILRFENGVLAATSQP